MRQRFFLAAGLPILALLMPGLSAAQSQPETGVNPVFKVTRFAENPIIRPDMDPQISRNINGPSLIRVPDWVEKPLGKYYLYFAAHEGTYIRMAYADDLHGPWKVHAPGTLQLSETACGNHIASPDVLVDAENKELLMYFHGKTRLGQLTFLARSKDGLAWNAEKVALGPAYFRVFKHDGWTYALTAVLGDRGSILMRSQDGATPFEAGPKLLPMSRHTAVLKRGDTLYAFFSRGEDEPERILVSEIKLKGDWKTWTASEPVTIIEPVEPYEGGDLPMEKSQFGKIYRRARQLRDPAVFEEDGKTYLLYSVAGEGGIAIAELTIP